MNDDVCRTRNQIKIKYQDTYLGLKPNLKARFKVFYFVPFAVNAIYVIYRMDRYINEWFALGVSNISIVYKKLLVPTLYLSAIQNKK